MMSDFPLTPYTKIYSIQIKDLNVKAKTMKLLKYRAKASQHWIGFGYNTKDTGSERRDILDLMKEKTCAKKLQPLHTVGDVKWCSH